MRRTAATALLLCLVATPLAAPAAETLMLAGRIHTLDPARPQAQAMVFDDAGRILALGAATELAPRYPAARRLDLGDATVIPGLIDAHGHVAGLGLSQLNANLGGAASTEEVVTRLRAFAATLPSADSWIVGRGWDQNLWPGKAFPTAAVLDAAFPDRPVWLRRVDGHAGWANSAAMRLAKRSPDGDWQPDGGRIERVDGKATGVFIDTAMDAIEGVIPDLDEATATRVLELGMQQAVASGLTGVHDAGMPLSQMRRYIRLADAGRLPMRITAWAEGDGDALQWLCDNGLYRHPGGRLQMRSVKVYADGALGSRGAAMLADYSDDPGNRGLLLNTPVQLLSIARKARACGVQVATHAIGDRGNRNVIEAYEQALGAEGLRSDHRWRIEHAQIIAPEDIARVARNGFIASMQPTHATSDMPWAEDRVGPDRVLGAYAWRRFRDAGVRLAFGSDFPIESVEPRLGLYAAVTRADLKGLPAGGWMPQEKVTMHEALRGFAIEAAHAGFSEGEVGSLAVGKRADFVVLRDDPHQLPASALPSLEIRATYVDGKAVYEAE